MRFTNRIMKKVFSLRLDERLIELIEKQRGDKTKTDYFTELLLKGLGMKKVDEFVQIEEVKNERN